MVGKFKFQGGRVRAARKIEYLFLICFRLFLRETTPIFVDLASSLLIRGNAGPRNTWDLGSNLWCERGKRFPYLLKALQKAFWGMDVAFFLGWGGDAMACTI